MSGERFLALHAAGAFVLDSEGRTGEHELGIKDIDEAVAQILDYEDSDRAPGFLARLLERLDRESPLVVETEKLARLLSRQGFRDVRVESAHPVFRGFRSRLASMLVEQGMFSSVEEFHKYMHDFTMEHTRRRLRKAAQKRDLLAAQAIRAIDDLDKTYNLFVIRLREWYSVHFPELDDLVRDHEQYVRLVAELGHRENFTLENLKKLGIPEQKALRIVKAAEESIGADLSEFDIEPIRTIARMAWEMSELRKRLSDYIDTVMREVAPNISALVGSLLGARLISLAGSLEELAKMPASTIQVLGAEKALFRALRTGGRPPKHGIIFQYPDVHKSPRWQRGKIARALASKLAIAAKVDAFTGRFIGDKLVQELRKRIEEIKKLYAKPPARPRESAPAQRAPSPGRRPGKHGKRRKKGKGRRR